MPDLPQIPPPTKDFQAAKRQFVELYGSTAVTNTYLKIAVLCLCGACLGLVWLAAKMYEASRFQERVVIRVNEIGRAEAVRYNTLEYHPQEAEIRYFLIRFVEQHYSRVRATLQDNYARSLYFLDGRLTEALMESNKKTKALESFMAGQAEQIEVDVKNVSIEDLRSAPYRATVDFEKIYYAPADHQELRREKYIANFVFMIKDRVPNSMIPVNPLGLTITYFREDQAFQ